ncbi:hypothetical protein K438DRAFT_1978802 [Mycena galopus ATCC 62051]|nr:hypothetical protein K438DRAFT_1978802 [Mycena galopus ATCC 62051]
MSTRTTDAVGVDSLREDDFAVAIGDERGGTRLFLPTSRSPTPFEDLEQMALEVMEPRRVATSTMLYSSPPQGIKRRREEDDDDSDVLTHDVANQMAHTLPVVGKDWVVADGDAQAVLPHTWARGTGGPTRGKLVLILGERHYLYMPQTPQDDEEFARLSNCPPCPDGYVISRSNAQRPYTCEEFLLVDHPNDDELWPFRGKNNKFVLSIACTWNTPALEAGDRVAVVSGDFVGAGGDIVEMGRDGDDVWAEVWGIPRAVPKDRVRVVLGIYYRDTEGRVAKIQDDILTIAVMSDTDVDGPCVLSETDPDIKTFEAPIYNVRRQFYRGDWVEATRGNHKGRIFVIIDFGDQGIVGENATRDQLFDMKFVVEMPVVDVKFWHRYTADIFLRHDCHPEHWNNMWKPVGAELNSWKGRRYEGIPVQVTKGPHKGFRGVVVGDHDSVSRARRLEEYGHRDRWDQDGILLTIGHETSNARIENIDIDHVWHEFTNLKLSRARFLPAKVLYGNEAAPNDVPEFRGSFPRPQTPPRPRTPTLPYTAPLWTEPDPSPILDGEETGQWISLPQLSMKRLDVKVVGVSKIRKASPTMAALEGKVGRLLITTPVPSGDPKVNVYGVGRNGLMHAVQRSCVKPRRVDDAGRSFWEITERVVVLGADVLSNSSHLGEYGQTIPMFPHNRGRGVVAVRFPGGAAEHPCFFHETMLCLAPNVHLPTGVGQINMNAVRWARPCPSSPDDPMMPTLSPTGVSMAAHSSKDGEGSERDFTDPMMPPLSPIYVSGTERAAPSHPDDPTMPPLSPTGVSMAAHSPKDGEGSERDFTASWDSEGMWADLKEKKAREGCEQRWADLKEARSCWTNGEACE